MPLNILIAGAGVAGPFLSILLLRSNPHHTITVVERSPALRTGGQQIDLRAQGIATVKRLGLLEAVRSRTVPEAGVVFVNAQGRPRAVFGVNDSGQGRQSLSSEYEIMRGDLVDVFYRESIRVAEKIREEHGAKGGGLEYVFGKYVTEMKQDEEDGVDVVFSDGATGRYDLVVGADGQGSRTRRMLFGEEASEKAFKFLGLYMAFFSIPRTEDDKDNMAKAYQMPECRAAFFRPGQLLLGVRQDTEELRASTTTTTTTTTMRSGVDEEETKKRAVWARLFDDCGWQRERLLEGLRTTDDFYAQQIGQIRMPRWSGGRVVLLGDAGYCPSPITGMGTTASLVGSYVLAGELARHGDDGVPAALEAYERVLRPFVDEIQKLQPGIPRLLYPKTAWGIWFLQSVLAVITMLRIDRLVDKLMPEDKGGWKLPDYPELKLDD